MNPIQPLPRALRAVAVLQLIWGVLAVIGIVVRLARGELHIDIGLLGIPIYFGLLRFSRGWRTCTLFFVWMGMIVAPLAFAMGIWGRAPTYFQVFGIELASVEPRWLAVASVPYLLLHFWPYRVLVRPDVRSLFQEPTGDVTS